MTFVEMYVKWSVTLTDRLVPEILAVLEIKRKVLHRVRLHVKVPGWLSNSNALLTKKLPKFLSRLNEMSGGRLQGFVDGRYKGEWNSVGFFVCSAVSRSISWARCLPVVTAESG